MKDERKALVAALLNLAATAVVVVLADPGLREAVRIRFAYARARAHDLTTERTIVPAPAEVSAMLAEAETITREAKG